MKKLSAGFVLLASGLLAVAAAAAPADSIVRYQMLYGGIPIADVEDRLVFSGDLSYRFSSHATAAGLAVLMGTEDIIRSSSGTIDAAGRSLMVDKFHQRQDAEQTSEVDRSDGMISINYKGGLSSVEFEPGQEIVDPLSLQYLFYVFPERAEEEVIEVLYTDGKRGDLHLYKRVPPM